MRKVITVFFICLAFIVKAQDEVSVEKSIWGVQIGIPNTLISNEPRLIVNEDATGNPTNGLMFYNELRLTNKIALKTEGGLGGYFRAYNHMRLLLTPTITVEPRFYLNLAKRKSQSLRIDNNMGSFIALNINYNPNLFNIRLNSP
jgi:hypothetical protein